jgi:twitching motility protein PilT
MRADITPLFQELVRRRASDLHIGTSTPPTFRIDGEFCRAEFSLPSDSDVTETLLGYLSDAQRAVFLETGDLDFALELQGLARFRVNYCRKYGGISAAFRPIPAKIPHIDSLGMPQVLKSLAQLRRGLIIVTGPTGSGKSTTLAAIINEINQQRSAHIITIEDPVEFVHESKMCLVTHREIGINAVSFSDALRAAVREDPDIIMVGEMRDLDTIYQSIKAAEMGLLVFGTLHTNSASRAVDRIIDVFPPDQQDQIRTMLADSLKAVVAQQLLRKAQGEGRVAAVEILLSVPGFSNLIREGKIHQIPSLIQMGKDAGMLSMDQSLIELVSRGLITKQEALSRAMDVRTFQRAGISSDTRYEEDDW